MKVRVVRYYLYICFFLFIIPKIDAAQSYGWPLRDNYGISATFGESREDHFHAGIDISTNGETGLPVLAIADGQIYRLKIQKRGYGRALYIQHPNGIQSVYAHLQGYSADLGLEQRYQQKVQSTGTRYVGDVFIEPPIAVKKGDVVAFSGESGAGLPHLHLEIRKNETEVLNPLNNGFRDSLDPVPPTFQSLYFYPQSADSAVDGDLETKEIRLKKKGADYVADEIPVVRGNFFASVSVYDSALRAYHRSPHKITYSMDGRVLYALEFNRFSYSQPQAFGLIYDLGKPGAAYYEYPVILSKLIDTPQPFVSSAVPFATKTLAPGIHRLRIEASDTNNNTSAADISFIMNEPPTLEIDEIQMADKNLQVTTTVSDPDWKTIGIRSIESQVEYSSDGGKTFRPFSLTSLEPQPGQGSLRFTSTLSIQDFRKLPARVIVKARGYDGVEYSSNTVKTLQVTAFEAKEVSKPLPRGTLRYASFGSAIRVFFDSNEMLSDPLELLVGTPPVSYRLQARGLTSYEATIPLPRSSGSLLVKLGEKQSITVPLQFLMENSGGRLRGENFQIDIDPGTLYWDTFVWTRTLPAYQAKRLPFVGPMLQLGPRGVPLRKSTLLSFNYPATIKYPEHLSIYNWDRANQKWVSLPSTVNQRERTVQTKISYFDLYALMYDNVAPTISNIFPKKRGSTTSNSTPTLAAGIQDRGMEVDDEKITFYVDGTAYVAEYDPDHNTATTKITAPLKNGYHRFYAVAYDYAGNKAVSKTVSFRVK